MDSSKANGLQSWWDLAQLLGSPARDVGPDTETDAHVCSEDTDITMKGEHSLSHPAPSLTEHPLLHPWLWP